MIFENTILQLADSIGLPNAYFAEGVMFVPGEVSAAVIDEFTSMFPNVEVIDGEEIAFQFN